MSSSPLPELRLRFCTQQAANYACKTYHYSRSHPCSPRVQIGVWEGPRFVGAIIFSRGAAKSLGVRFGLEQDRFCELTRVALSKHRHPVTRMVAVAIRMLKNLNPGLRLIISFADPEQGHVGAIYQAGGWTYTGTSMPSQMFVDKNGRKWHARQASKTGKAVMFNRTLNVVKRGDCTKVIAPGKHRYVFPLDDEMRAVVAPLALPYPKREPLDDASVV